MSLIRDYYIKRKGKKFPLYYVLIAGLAGILPDFDVVAFWGLYFLGFPLSEVHRTFTHTLFVPLLFLLLALLFLMINIKPLSFRKHKLNWSIIMLMIAFGSFIHLVLDAILSGSIIPFYPLSYVSIGLNLFGYLPKALEELAAPSLDTAIIVIWIVYLELKHKISDFI